MTDGTICGEDLAILRNLARRVAEIAALREMRQRRELWVRHNRLEPGRPMIYIDPQGSWQELLPASRLICRDDRARRVERALRAKIHAFEHFASDNVVEGRWVVRKVMRDNGWGLERKWRNSSEDRGAKGFEPVLLAPSDLKKLRIPTVEYDEAATAGELQWAQEIFGDILRVEVKGVDWLSYHLMNQYSGLRGLDQAMLDMCDNPSLVHEAMAFLEEAHRDLLRQYTRLNLLSLNNDDTPIYTAGYGYSDELPQRDWDGTRVRPRDIWCWAEAQEMAVVSPEMHHEFVFVYEKRLLAPFGLNGYGCCDDLARKLDFVLTIANLRRVSISPWSDVEACARRLGRDVIFMWKPQPAHLVGTFNADLVRAYLRRTIDAARANGCVLEIALLDTHTCENHPERFEQWSRIAREEALAW